MEPEPRERLEEDILLTHIKVSLDIYLKCLIQKQKQESQQQNMFELHVPGFCKYNDKGATGTRPVIL
jgi:hypothetical protein